MIGPEWLAVVLAALMLLIAASCMVRLVIWKTRGRETEADADGLHVLMGVAMAGMFEPRLSLVPGGAWRAVFAAAAAWFLWRALRGRSRRAGDWLCAHPAPHAAECAVMFYMLMPGSAAGRLAGGAMAGMGGSGPGSNPAIALVLALFTLGYVFWTTDRLAALSRTAAAAASYRSPAPRLAPAVAEPAAASAGLAPGLSAAVPARGLGGASLAPRFAASYKIAMGIAMGYMLITMV
jgi:hypothetical protein